MEQYQLGRNKELVVEFTKAFNAGDIESMAKYFDLNAEINGVSDGSLDSAKKIWSELISAFNVQLEIHGLCAEGSVVAALYTEKGKFTAPFKKHKPTGLAYQVVAMHWFEISNGLIVKRWGLRNIIDIANQVGISISTRKSESDMSVQKTNIQI